MKLSWWCFNIGSRLPCCSRYLIWNLMSLGVDPHKSDLLVVSKSVMSVAILFLHLLVFFLIFWSYGCAPISGWVYPYLRNICSSSPSEAQLGWVYAKVEVLLYNWVVLSMDLESILIVSFCKPSNRDWLLCAGISSNLKQIPSSLVSQWSIISNYNGKDSKYCKDSFEVSHNTGRSCC